MNEDNYPGFMPMSPMATTSEERSYRSIGNMPKSVENGSSQHSADNKLQHKKSVLMAELELVNQAMSMIDANPHFANVMSAVERALKGM